MKTLTKLIDTIKLPYAYPRIIADAKDIFPGWIDSDFKNYGLNTDGSRNESYVEVHDLVENGTFKEIFESFGRNLEDMVVSQGQVIKFAKTIKKDDPCIYFFLLKSGDTFFVAFVRRNDGKLSAYVYHFGRDGVWRAEYRRRFVLHATSSSESKTDLGTSADLTLKQAIEVCKKNGLNVTKTY